MNRRRLHLLAVALAFGAAQGALACAFHGYTPNPTLVDVLMDTEQVMVARPAASGYSPIATLIGPDVMEVPIGVGPDVRLRLNARPGATVLLARDGSYGPWVEVAVMNTRYLEMVEDVMARQSDWQFGGDAARLDYFKARIADKDPDIRQLALLELDRAPYLMLKQLRVPVVQGAPGDLRSGDASTLPIRILLAGLSGEQGHVPAISGAMQLAIRDDVPFLGAYATALIELEGPTAVTSIVDRYLKPGHISAVNAERLLEALALQQKTGAASLRNFISRQVSGLLRSAPQYQEAAARQFGYSSRWQSGAAVSEVER